MKAYRLRIKSPNGGTTYFVRTANGKTSYMSGSETPLSLANLISDSAAETRFKLEDALNGSEAARILQLVLSHQWRNNKPLCPEVEEFLT